MFVYILELLDIRNKVNRCATSINYKNNNNKLVNITTILIYLDRLKYNNSFDNLIIITITNYIATLNY